MSAETAEKFTIDFEETELRLGLPGKACGVNSNGESVTRGSGKRGFLETVDLKLNLSSKEDDGSIEDIRTSVSAEKKMNSNDSKEKSVAAAPSSSEIAKPPAKAQVVGWPPVRSFRKNIMAAGAAFVKVSMDGAPYLRKVDLQLYKSYQDLSDALAKMFSSFTIGNCGSGGMKDFMNESKLIDLLNGSEYVPTYEDKDGDWMLVGDVPWDMFVDSCKRLRIMKGSEAIGLAPRAVEKMQEQKLKHPRLRRVSDTLKPPPRAHNRRRNWEIRPARERDRARSLDASFLSRPFLFFFNTLSSPLLFLLVSIKSEKKVLKDLFKGKEEKRTCEIGNMFVKTCSCVSVTSLGCFFLLLFCFTVVPGTGCFLFFAPPFCNAMYFCTNDETIRVCVLYLPVNIFLIIVFIL